MTFRRRASPPAKSKTCPLCLVSGAGGTIASVRSWKMGSQMLHLWPIPDLESHIYRPAAGPSNKRTAGLPFSTASATRVHQVTKCPPRIKTCASISAGFERSSAKSNGIRYDKGMGSRKHGVDRQQITVMGVVQEPALIGCPQA